MEAGVSRKDRDVMSVVNSGNEEDDDDEEGGRAARPSSRWALINFGKSQALHESDIELPSRAIHLKTGLGGSGFSILESGSVCQIHPGPSHPLFGIPLLSLSSSFHHKRKDEIAIYELIL